MNILNTKTLMALLLTAGLTACNTADNNDTDRTEISKTTTYETKVENNTNGDYTANTTKKGATATITHVNKDSEVEAMVVDPAHGNDTVEHNVDKTMKKAGKMMDDASKKVSATVDGMTTPQGKTIVTITEQDPEFSTLNGLIQTAGLTDTLSSGEYTIFAPTNAAFAAVPKATMDKLANNKELLKEVLMYHVVSNKVPAEAVVKMTETQPLRKGAGIIITPQQDGVVMLNNKTRVIKTDVMADNGVVHVIDTVLMPSDLTL